MQTPPFILRMMTEKLLEELLLLSIGLKWIGYKKEKFVLAGLMLLMI